MIHWIFRIPFLCLCVFFASADALEVVATTSDLGHLVKRIGGASVNVFTISRGVQDPHQIEAKPSMMVKMRNADLLILQGLDLESAWLEPLVDGSRNVKLKDVERRLELGPLLSPIEKAEGSISRAEGDVHPNGNPHFQLDPERMAKAAELIGERLALLDKDNRELYAKNAVIVAGALRSHLKSWAERILKSQQKEIVTFHRTFSYFCDRFQIKCQLQLEPKPGLPPSANHLLKVIEAMKSRQLRVVLIENYFDDSVVAKLKEAIPKLVIERVPVSVEGEEKIQSTEDLIERLVTVIEKAKNG